MHMRKGKIGVPIKENTIGVLNITSRQQIEVVIGHPPMLMKDQDKVYDDIILYSNGSSINKLYQEDLVMGFSAG